MMFVKCDLCKKEIDKMKKVVAGTAHLDVMELCYDCGSPVVKFLEEHKFFKEEKYKNT